MSIVKNNSRGYVITADVSSVKNIICDEVWQITRAGNHIPGTLWVPDLAPGPQLFKRYLHEWKDRPGNEWWDRYKELFEQELRTDEKLNALRKIWNYVESGRVIALVCYCRDSRYCHRTLVGNFLEQHGVRVEEHKKAKNNTEVAQLTLF